jgi:hypothetical protein
MQQYDVAISDTMNPVGITVLWLRKRERTMANSCAACHAPASRFDVHCRNCGTVLEVPSLDEQFVALGLDLEQLERESAERSLAIHREASRARTRANNQAIGREVAAAMGESITVFFREVFRP